MSKQESVLIVLYCKSTFLFCKKNKVPGRECLLLRESRNLKRRWVQGIFAVAFVVGLFWMLAGSPVMVKAGTLEYHASISSSTSGSDITFNCDLDQTIDGQRASYQWQENRGSGWQDISGQQELPILWVRPGKRWISVSLCGDCGNQQFIFTVE